ncbi:MAG TPA: hypothetical protein VH186_17585 [Chloroflexia bacterium]|nr:hypothetical protein [Chloroflexia bacterium]
MALIGEDDRQYLTERFNQDLEKDVTIEFFSYGSYHTPEAVAAAADIETLNDSDDVTSEACRVSKQIYDELAEINQHIKVVFHDLDTPEGQQTAASAGVDASMLPAALYQSDSLAGQSRFYGIPSGYEFGTLVENLIDLSKGRTNLSQKTQDSLANLDKPARVLVFVTPT